MIGFQSEMHKNWIWTDIQALLLNQDRMPMMGKQINSHVEVAVKCFQNAFISFCSWGLCKLEVQSQK